MKLPLKPFALLKPAEASNTSCFGTAQRCAQLCTLAIALWLFAAGCEPAVSPKAAAPLNVVLITIDTQRADRLGSYGYAKAQTPNLDRLAAEGVRFEHAYCDVTWTTPSMASVMTGTYAPRHGMRSTYQQLDPLNETLAERLKAQGYQTAAIIGSFPLDSVFGLDQGFDSYDDTFTAPIMTGGERQPQGNVESKFSKDIDEQRLFQFLKSQADAYRPDDQVSDAAIAWLSHRKASPFFLWVHYFGPHELVDARLDFDAQNRQIVEVYDRDVSRTDREVGRFLKALDDAALRESTVVIVHADHGQSLGDHLYVGHGKNLYDPTMRIPLILRAPGKAPAGKVVHSLARNIDVFPTILDLARLSAKPGVDGSSLRALWESDSNDGREIYAETYLPATDAFAEVIDNDGAEVRVGVRRRGIRTPDWKLVLTEPWPLLDYAHPPAVPQAAKDRLTAIELFDLRTNPLELQGRLIKDRPDIVAQLQAKIEAYNQQGNHGTGRRELSDADRERLRSLGYMH